MKTLFLSLAVLTAVVLATSPVMAQQQPRRGGGGPGMYLNAKSVQEELKLSEDDAKKITEELGKIGQDVRGAERAEKTQKILKDHLRPEQLKRLNQIMWQRGGVGSAVNNPDVQAALKLDDKQKEKIRSLQMETQTQLRELRKDAAANREKIAELTKKTAEDVNAVLTDEQKKAWKELLGAEFKGEIGRPRPPTN